MKKKTKPLNTIKNILIITQENLCRIPQKHFGKRNMTENIENIKKYIGKVITW